MALTKEEAARLVIQDECYDYAEAGNSSDMWAEWLESTLEAGRKGQTLDQFALEILNDRYESVKDEPKAEDRKLTSFMDSVNWDEALQVLGWEDK